jgi:hypothetical protein
MANNPNEKKCPGKGEKGNPNKEDFEKRLFSLLEYGDEKVSLKKQVPAGRKSMGKTQTLFRVQNSANPGSVGTKTKNRISINLSGSILKNHTLLASRPSESKVGSNTISPEPSSVFFKSKYRSLLPQEEP